MSPKPEIIAPAGDLEKLHIALVYGADAVYCGLPAVSLRARENEFTLDGLIKARTLTREKGVRMYLTCNVFPRQPQMAFIERFIRDDIPKIQPDAVVAADPGMIHLLRKYAPEVKIHLSVQANTVNAATVRFWYDVGVRRVILARELSIHEIKAIHAAVPEMELECFVHGSICFTYSGRCLISNYLTNRDGNRGVCANACRWKWSEKDSAAEKPVRREMLVSEENRSGETFELTEDEHGSYLFNSKDLCLIDRLGELAAAGVTGFKIEGRHKSVGYLATIVRAYRLARDAAADGKPFDLVLLREIAAVGNRGYTTGFFDGSQKDLQNYERKEAENPQTFLGIVEEMKKAKGKMQNNLPFVRVKNRFEVGDAVEVITPTEIFTTTIRAIHDEKGESLTVAHGGMEKSVFVDLGQDVPPYALLRLAA